MDRLRCLQVFVAVARAGSFSAAANRLGIARSGVTKHVLKLERDVGASLFVRTTQRTALTEAGSVMLVHAEDLLARSEALNESVRLTADGQSGVVRIGAPPSFGARMLGPAVVAFSRAYPDVQVSLGHDFGSSDLIREGFDVSVRIVATLKDSSFVAIPLGITRQVLVASPSYLDARGRPTCIEDLKAHNCLIHSLKSPTAHWELEGPQGPVSAFVRGNIRSDFGDAIRVAALEHHGIAMHLLYMVNEDIQAGRLERILPDHHPPSLGIYALIPAGRKMPRRVRVLTDFLADWFARDDRESAVGGVDAPSGARASGSDEEGMVEWQSTARSDRRAEPR